MLLHVGEVRLDDLGDRLLILSDFTMVVFHQLYFFTVGITLILTI